MAMTFDSQRSSCRSDVEKTGQCAKEEVSSSLLGKLAPPFLCYKHIPSIRTYLTHTVKLITAIQSTCINFCKIEQIVDSGLRCKL